MYKSILCVVVSITLLVGCSDMMESICGPNEAKAETVSQKVAPSPALPKPNMQETCNTSADEWLQETFKRLWDAAELTKVELDDIREPWLTFSGDVLKLARDKMASECIRSTF